jgi:hypothetical protein
VQKYDCGREFAEWQVWDPAVSYKALTRVYLDAAEYSASSTYSVGNTCLHSGSVYVCNHAITVAEAFNAGHWTLVGAQYAKYFASLPYDEFVYDNVYMKGDQVWWNDKVYSCEIATVLANHSTSLQYQHVQNLPSRNAAPDDRINGKSYWGTGSAYAIPAGYIPAAWPAKWTAADSRNPQMVNACIDCALYLIHGRIAPRNIPDLRVKRYDDTIRWLKSAAKGDITADLPVIQPKQGRRIRFGGEVRRINNY